MTGDAEAEVVLSAMLAMPNVIESMANEIDFRKIYPFMLCSLDLLAV